MTISYGLVRNQKTKPKQKQASKQKALSKAFHQKKTFSDFLVFVALQEGLATILF